MATTSKQFSASLTFTETEFRAPVKTNLNETKCGAVLPSTTGYCLYPTLIENESQLISNFGYPTDYNYKYWYDCSGFLKNGSSLNLIRPMIDGSENAGIEFTITGEPSATSGLTGGTDMYNPEVALNRLDNFLPAEGKAIQLFNRYVCQNDDLAVAVISNSSAYSSPLFNDFKLVSGLSYYYKKDADFINDTAVKYDVEYVLDHSSTFASDYYGHVYNTYTDFLKATALSAPDATTNAGKCWIDTTSTILGRYTATVTGTIVAGELYRIVDGTTSVILKGNATADGFLEVKSDANFDYTKWVTANPATLLNLNGTPTDLTAKDFVKHSNVYLSVDLDGAGVYEWIDLDLYILPSIVTIDSTPGKVYVFQKQATALTITGTNAGTYTYYDLKLATGVLPVLADSNPWHLIIDGNNYNIDQDGKFYTCTTGVIALLGVSDPKLKPTGYNMVYTKDGNGIKVLSKIVAKYLEDSLYLTDGSIVTGKDVLAPVPNFSKNELAVLVFKKSFVSGKFDLVESFIGNYNYNAKNSSGGSAYIEKLINQNSQFLYCNVQDGLDMTEVGGINTKNSSITSLMIIDGSTATYDRVINRRNGDTGTEEYLSAVDLRTAVDEFSIRGNTLVNLLIGYDNGLMSGYMDDMSEIAKESGTALAVISYDSGDYAGQKASVISAAIIDALGNKRQDTTSGMLTSFNDYTFVISTSKLLYDKYNDKDRWMGLAGDIAGKMAANDAVNGSWYAVAGTDRGFINNYKKLLWSPSSVDQNELSRNGLNCIINDKELGYAYMFEFLTNTTENKITAEANIRRLVITLKDYLRTTLKGTFFSFNDAIERSAVLYKITDTFLSVPFLLNTVP